MSVKQGGIEYLFGMTHPVIEPGLLGHWQTLYPLGQWTSLIMGFCNWNNYHFNKHFSPTLNLKIYLSGRLLLLFLFIYLFFFRPFPVALLVLVVR